MKVFIECCDVSAVEAKADARGEQSHIGEAVMLSRLQADVLGDQATVMESLISALLQVGKRVRIEVMS